MKRIKSRSRYINKSVEQFDIQLKSLFEKFKVVFDRMPQEWKNVPVFDDEYHIIHCLDNTWRVFINKLVKKNKAEFQDDMSFYLKKFRALCASYLLEQYYGISASIDELINHYNIDINEMAVNYIKTI